MIVKLLFIVAASIAVFWLIGRLWPRLRGALRGRVIPLLLSPMILPLLRRVVMTLLRIFLFRR